MSIEIETHPHAGRFDRFKLGRLATLLDARTLQLERYVDVQALPVIPASVDYTAKVPQWPMYGNDTLGDCTVAAVGHMIEAWAFNAGKPKIPTVTAIERMYWETGTPPSGTGTPGGPTDTGRYELQILNRWRKIGVARDHIVGYASINPANVPLVKAAIYLFGGVYTGIALPLTAQRQHVWDYVGGAGSEPGSWGGHAVPYHAFDAQGVVVPTWGGLMRATWAFHQHYTDEVYALINKDWLDQAGHSPTGLDLAALEADLAKVGRVG